VSIKLHPLYKEEALALLIFFVGMSFAAITSAPKYTFYTENFGVICDGSTDNLTALQRIENLADDVAGAKIVFSGGECAISATWEIDAPGLSFECGGSGGPLSDGNTAAQITSACTITQTATDATPIMRFVDNDKVGANLGNSYTNMEGMGFKCEDASQAGKNAIEFTDDGSGASPRWSFTNFDKLFFSDCAGYGISVGQDVYGEGVSLTNFRYENMGGMIEGLDDGTGGTTYLNASQFIIKNHQFGISVNSASVEEHILNLETFRQGSVENVVIQGTGNSAVTSYMQIGGETLTKVISFHGEITTNEPPFSIYMSDNVYASSDKQFLYVEGLNVDKPISLSDNKAKLNIIGWNYFDPDDDSLGSMIDESRVIDTKDFGVGSIDVHTRDVITVPDGMVGRYRLTVTPSNGAQYVFPDSIPLVQYDGLDALDWSTTNTVNSYENNFIKISTDQGGRNFASQGIYDDADNHRVYGVNSDGNEIPRFIFEVNVPADNNAETFTCDTANDEIDATGHDFVDNDIVIASSTTTVCAGISTSRRYYVDNATANTYQLTTCYDGCGVVDITSTGTGTHTMTRWSSFVGRQVSMAARYKVVSSATTGAFTFLGSLMDGAQGNHGSAQNLTDVTGEWRDMYAIGIIDEDATGFQRLAHLNQSTVPDSTVQIFWDEVYMGWGATISVPAHGRQSDNQILRLTWCAGSAPTVGDYLDGDMCINTSAATGSPPYWMVTTPGSPGTWTAAPNL